jgi:tetratricopeptide (TPR) repeat protein
VEGREWLIVALSAAGNLPTVERAEALAAAGVFSRALADVGVARAYLEESAALNAQLDNREGLSRTLRWLGMLLLDLDQRAEAHEALTHSLDVATSADDTHGRAQSLSFLGESARVTENYPEAERLNVESAELFRELGNNTQLATALQNAGFAALRSGALGRAERLFRESLAVVSPMSDRLVSPVSCAGLAAWCAATGRAEEATRLFGAVDAQLRSTGYTLNRVDQRDRDHGMAQARRALSAAEFETAWTQGQVMSFEAAVEYALRLANGEPTALETDVPGSVTSSPPIHPSNVV